MSLPRDKAIKCMRQTDASDQDKESKPFKLQTEKRHFGFGCNKTLEYV